MKLSHLVSLLVRCITLIILGLSISWIWRNCHLEHYESWGKFYAIWIPVLYVVFSMGYMFMTGYYTRNGFSPEISHKLNKRLSCYFNYDDYTYLLLLGILGLEVSAPYIQNVFLWLSVCYLALVIIKSSLFLLCFYEHIRQTSLQNHFSRHFSGSLQIVLVLTAFFVYSLISGYHIHRASITGDEPHYLLITHSLWHDHDTNLYNNYNNRDYESFYWHELRPTWGDQVSKTEIYSYRHKGGFPHTLLPGYVLGGQLGVVFQSNLITALLMLQVFLLSYELFHSLTAAFATWICTAFTVPVIIYMGQIYPETLAALLAIWIVRRIRKLQFTISLRQMQFWKDCVMIGVPLILLVLLKTRYLPLAGALGFFLLFHVFQGRLHIRHKARTVIGFIIILLLVTLVAFLIDSLFFDNMFRDRINDTKYMTWMLEGYNPLSGFLGLLFDQEHGLFIYTPLYMLACVGIGLLTRRELRDTFPIFMIFLLNYAVICLWPLWHAAPTPPSRYILPILPLFAVFMTKFFEQGNKGLYVIILGICGIWSSLVSWVITLNPWWRYNWADGTNNFLEMLSRRLSVNLVHMFPSWTRVSPATPYLTISGFLCIGVLIYLCRLETKKPLPFLRTLSPEFNVLIILGVFVSMTFSGLVTGKILPTSTLEAEDSLDVRTYGGERVPASFDPWDNQLYLRERKYFGWKLHPGDRINIRPKLYHLLPLTKTGQPVEWELQIFARAQLDKQNPQDFPVMQILMDGKEVSEITVSETGWDTYSVTLLVDGQRPNIEIKHQSSSDSQRALIIDKVRFQ